jgi:hypothetical protein
MSRALFLRKLRKYVAAIPALAFGFVASPAFSAVITVDASGVTAGATSASFVGSTLTSTGGSFTKTTTTGINPSVAIGVSAGFAANEIDISGEKLTLHFGSTGAIINQITIALLHNVGVSGNTFNDAAHIQSNAGTSCGVGSPSGLPCILSSSTSWRGATTKVTELSAPTSGNGGIFRITNPFNVNELINSIDFMAWSITGVGATDSDFALVSVTYTTTAIPEPGSFALVGLGILGLAAAGRRRARS